MSRDIKEIAINLAIAKLSESEVDLLEEDIDEFTYEKLTKIIPLLYEDANLEEKDFNYINKQIKTRMNHTIKRTDSVLKTHDHRPWFKKEKGNLNLKYWKRYSKYLFYKKHFNKNIIDSIDDVSDEITDLLGNPNINGEFQRRGLVIGDVQSGKTANFIALMCKASDAGYGLIVVLAGTSNELRKQTQSRVDEGLLGYDSDSRQNNEFKKIGAGEFSEDFSPINVTSLSEDFNKRSANTLGLKLNQTIEPIVFVIKKNVTVLKNLNSWISSLNQTNESGKIDASLLVIDDESDYASINTNKEDEDPTKTNEKIEELLFKFTRTSYIGFTATPYANVFINPLTNDEMKKASLFPKDYIYCLDSPSNYIGARNIFGDDSDNQNMIITIENEDDNIKDSIHDILPLNHKKNHDFEKVPQSLKEAIATFVVANVIRDLRGDSTAHRSMMINISIFVNVHDKIKTEVKHYLSSMIRSIQFYSNLPGDSWQRDEFMCLINKMYCREYKQICEDEKYNQDRNYPVLTWDIIKTHLYESAAPIKVRVVNQKTKDSMNFSKEKDTGLRVIAIGGIGLSRGLTLEGLMVSYFFRNSKTYDTLMQMGRWFGYRDGYEDLCRIWMTDDMFENFCSINRATEELRESIKLYKDSDMTPLDFGIKVRTDTNLLITAKNKMRTAKEELMECTLSSKVIETPYIKNDKEFFDNNYQQTLKFIQFLNKKYEMPLSGKKIVCKAVDYRNIITYVKSLLIPKANVEFQNTALENFILDNLEILSNWDVAIVQGNKKIKTFSLDNGKLLEICPVVRQVDIKPSTDLIRISKQRCRVGGPSDGTYGLSQKQIEMVKKSKGSKVSQTAYFDQKVKRNPLLCIYFVECANKDLSDKNINKVIEYSRNTPIIAISIGIPGLGKNSKMIKYALNLVEQGFSERNLTFDGDSEYEE